MAATSQRPPFGGLQISSSDDAGTEWLEEARRRYETDAEFHYRAHGVRQALHAAYVNAPTIGHICVALLLDEKVRRANGLR